MFRIRIILIRIRIQDLAKFVTYPEPDRTFDMDPDPGKKGFITTYQEDLKNLITKSSFPMLSVFITVL